MFKTLSIHKKTQTIAVGILVFFLTIQPSILVHAEEVDTAFYSGNDIIFYNPSASNGACKSLVPVTLTGKNNLEKIFNYFIDKGFSREQAAGVIGNVSQESGGDPTLIQGGGHTNDPSTVTGGWGLIQWTPGSKAMTAAKAAGANGPIYELSTQLDILWGHMNNKPPITTGKFSIEDYKTITDVKEAVDYFEKNIEGAGDPQIANRYAAAMLALDEFSGSSSTSSTNSTSQPLENCESGNPGAATGNVAQTAINYAWPTYHAPNYLELKPTYAAAIAKAKSEGKYVGGGPHPGVDCGGFVTRVMQDSGVDTEYGGGGNTTSQLNHLLTSGKYRELSRPTTSDLSPGAIAIKTTGGGHTYLYVGKQSGFETQIASASYSPSGTAWRSPMAGKEAPADPEYRWFVLK